MPNHKSTEKSLRKSVKLRQRNVSAKSRIRTLIKKVRLSVEQKNLDASREMLRQAVSALDTAAKKHIIHPRNASRRKARLMRLVDRAAAQ
ncbi:MAG TPA: 30S ribosomal protein S20 [bacterium]|jgi:small subunit ribosomal protein S20|nr:30S ribosomal protein S20 [bacterium]HOL94972.1 30S ribosomal protein S20 [bacterium]HPP02524.1 30S ribosomal protein S20 [bacterium]